MQKLLTSAARLPQQPLLSAFTDASASLNLSLQTSKRELKKRIKELQWLQKQMFRISETNVKLKYPADELEEGKEEQSLDELWSKLDKNFSITLPFVEQTIDRWNNQTQLLGNLKQSSKKTSHFSQTIISQVNSLLA